MPEASSSSISIKLNQSQPAWHPENPAAPKQKHAFAQSPNHQAGGCFSSESLMLHPQKGWPKLPSSSSSLVFPAMCTSLFCSHWLVLFSCPWACPWVPGMSSKEMGVHSAGRLCLWLWQRVAASVAGLGAGRLLVAGLPPPTCLMSTRKTESGKALSLLPPDVLVSEGQRRWMSGGRTVTEWRQMLTVLLLEGNSAVSWVPGQFLPVDTVYRVSRCLLACVATTEDVQAASGCVGHAFFLHPLLHPLLGCTRSRERVPFPLSLTNISP